MSSLLEVLPVLRILQTLRVLHKCGKKNKSYRNRHIPTVKTDDMEKVPISSLFVVKNVVSKALEIDAHEANLSAAFIKYLESLSLICDALLQECRQGTVQNTLKLLKLGKQCMDRALDIFQDADFSIGNPVAGTVVPFNLQPDAKLPDVVSGPMLSAQKQNQKLLSAYRSRMAGHASNKQIVTNMSLSLQRQMVENLEIAKAREKSLMYKLEERHRRRQMEVKRQVDLGVGLSPEERERRLLFLEVLEFEKSKKQLLSWREELKNQPQNAQLVSVLIPFILNQPAHPITKLVHSSKDKILQYIYPLLDKYRSVSFDWPTGSATGGQGGRNTDPLAEVSGGVEVGPASLPGEVSEKAGASALEDLEHEALVKHVKEVVHDVHRAVDTIQTVWLVVYEDLDNETARELCYYYTEVEFFKDLWVYVLAIFRMANRQKESQFQRVVEKFKSLPPSALGVGAKFELTAELPTRLSYAYESAVRELLTVTTLCSPVQKLNVIVCVSQLVCKCLEEHYKQLSEPVPSLGADDLLPILSYVLVKSGCVSIVSECQALEEFIHESYLLGEEGYCLTSLQTALTYLLSLPDT